MLYFDDPYCFASGAGAKERIERARKWFTEKYPNCSFYASESPDQNIGGYHIHIEENDVDIDEPVWRFVITHFFSYPGEKNDREQLLIEYLMNLNRDDLNDYQKKQMEYVKKAMEIIGLTHEDAVAWSNKIHEVK